MTLADALRQEPPKKANHPCAVSRIRTELDKKDRQSLDEAILQIKSTTTAQRSSGQARFTIAWLTNVLRKEGFKLNRDSVGRHVRGECSCEFE
jgi:hypothetical protein